MLRFALLLLLAIPTRAWQAGPMPDFAPLGTIVSHVYAHRLAPELPLVLGQLVGARSRAEGWTKCAGPACQDLKLGWMRDYTPTFVRRRDGSLKLVGWLSPNEPTAGYVEVVRTLPGVAGVPLERVPLLVENGNLVSTGDEVFMTPLVFLDNRRPHPELRELGYTPQPPEAVVRLLARALERAEANVHVIPPMPGEATLHADLVLLPLGPKEVLVPEVEPKALASFGSALGHQVRRYLDDRVAELHRLGFKVVRAPMLPPLGIGTLGDGRGRNLFFSPANSLLLNVEGRRHAVLPHLTFPPGAPPALVQLEQSYEARWATLFRARGWLPVSVDATELSMRVGLLRCATWPVPPLEHGHRG